MRLPKIRLTQDGFTAALLGPLEISNRMRVTNSGGAVTSVARPINATAPATSRASSSQALHEDRWLSTADF